MKVAAISMLISCSLSACSNQQIYTAIQENRKTECMKLPASEYDECMEGYTKSYAEYEKERQKFYNPKQ